MKNWALSGSEHQILTVLAFVPQATIASIMIFAVTAAVFRRCSCVIQLGCARRFSVMSAITTVRAPAARSLVTAVVTAFVMMAGLVRLLSSKITASAVYLYR